MFSMTALKAGMAKIAAFGNIHAPAILTIAGGGLLVATVIEAIHATPVYEKILDDYVDEELKSKGYDKENDASANGEDGNPEALKAIAEELRIKSEKVPFKKRFVMYCKAYWKTALLGAGSLLCFILSNRISAKRLAAMAAGYAMAEDKLKEYKKKVSEIVGPKKVEEINTAIATDKVNKVVPNANVICTGQGTTWFMDSCSNQVFQHDIGKIEQIVNELNADLLDEVRRAPFDDEARIRWNDFARAIGIKPTKVGDMFGWDFHKHGIVKIDMSRAVKLEDGRVVIYLDYETFPFDDAEEYANTDVSLA